MKNYMRGRYQNDPEFRERMKTSAKAYHSKKRAEKYYVNECEVCGKERVIKRSKSEVLRSNIDLHHIADEAYGNETTENTAVLCEHCHIVANLLKSYFGDINKIKLLDIIKKLREEDPVRNVREKAIKLINLSD